MHAEVPPYATTSFDFIKSVYCIVPLPRIRIVVDSGFRITAICPFLQIIGFSNVSFSGDIDENLAALICRPTLTKQP